MSIRAQEDADLAALVDRVRAQHVAIRHDLAEATRLAELHGSGELVGAVETLASELEDHMAKEENVLLPWIRAGRGATAGAPIRAMAREHEQTLAAVARIRDLTGGYRAPTEALAPLYLRLDGLDRLLRAHIVLENDVLFPLALRS
jgi:regulator of cell morphogenesis and NO signaling